MSSVASVREITSASSERSASAASSSLYGTSSSNEARAPAWSRGHLRVDDDAVVAVGDLDHAVGDVLDLVGLGAERDPRARVDDPLVGAAGDALVRRRPRAPTATVARPWRIALVRGAGGVGRLGAPRRTAPAASPDDSDRVAKSLEARRARAGWRRSADPTPATTTTVATAPPPAAGAAAAASPRADARARGHRTPPGSRSIRRAGRARDRGGNPASAHSSRRRAKSRLRLRALGAELALQLFNPHRMPPSASPLRGAAWCPRSTRSLRSPRRSPRWRGRRST